MVSFAFELDTFSSISSSSAWKSKSKKFVIYSTKHDSSNVIRKFSNYLFFFNAFNGVFDFIIAGHLLTMNVDGSAAFNQFECDRWIGEFQHRLDGSRFAGFQYGHGYFDLVWFWFAHRWCFNLKTNNCAKVVRELFRSSMVFIVCLFKTKRKVAYFNDIVFIVLCRMAKQKLANNQFVERVWKFFSITNDVPFHGLIARIKCGC